MKFDITGRNIEITPAIRDFTRDKLAKLERWIDEVIEAHVILAVEKHRHVAEIVVKGRHHTFTGTDETGDMYASIGNVVDKLEKQSRKLKDKVVLRRKHARSTHDLVTMPPIANPGRDGGRSAARGAPQIIRSNEFSKKPMSVEDAALALVDSDRDFLIFREARSQRISVMYRRSDGNLGLIESET